MVKSIVKGVIFFAILLFANFALQKILPVGAGSKLQQVKFQNFNSYPSEVDAVFIGSSRTSRHINVNLIDSLMTQCTGKTFVSYNLGLTDMNVHRNIYMSREVLKLRNPPRYIFLEITAKQHEKNNNLSTSQASFYVSNKTLRDLTKIINRDEELSDFEKTLKENYYKAWYRRQLHLGYGKEYLAKSSKSYRGYAPIKDLGPTEGLISQKDQFLRKLKSYDNAFYADMKRYSDNSGISDLCLELIEEAEQEGVQIVFFLNATPHGFKQEFAIFNSIPTTHRMSLHLYNKISQLRTINSWHDPYHMNTYGANIVSKRFSSILCGRLKNGSIVPAMR